MVEAGSGFVSFGVTLFWNEMKCVLHCNQSGLLGMGETVYGS